MKQNKLISVRLLRGLSILFLVAIVACSARLFSYKGLEVSENNLIRLENGGPHDGIWSTGDLAVVYRYTRKADNLQISGDIRFEDSLRYNFTRLDHFDLWIHLLNSENKIVEYRNLSPHVHYFEIDKIPFDETIPLPPGINAISFSYSGRASEGGNDRDEKTGGGTSWEFWKTPQG